MNELVSIASELVAERKMLLDALKRLERSIPGEAARRSVAALHESVSRVGGLAREILKMTQAEKSVELAELFALMELHLHGIGERGGKEAVLLNKRGEHLSMDADVLKAVSAPILELLSLSLEFGVESARERELRGKSARVEMKTHAAATGAGISLTIAYDGNGVEPPVSEALSREMGAVGVRAEFEGVPSRWSMWRAMFPASRRSMRCLKALVGGMEVAIPVWSQSAREPSGSEPVLRLDSEWELKPAEKGAVEQGREILIGAGTRRARLMLSGMRGADEALIRALPGNLLSGGRLMGLAVWPGLGALSDLGALSVELLPVLDPNWVAHGGDTAHV